MAIKTLLVANRGEIARRIMRSAKAMGLQTVAVYSDADANAPHVTEADVAVHIGAGPARESYLDTDKILKAARGFGADAIHPGYGFLSENAAFAHAVEEAGICFVGPTPKAIEAMGDKAAAKRLMEAAGVPCVPGYHGKEQSDAALREAANKIGFPIMVKASAGGGGKGMRLVQRAEDMADALALARSEAMRAFGSDQLILEKAILRPRHVEIQVFADTHGNCIHIGERDCSVQRRHQKVIEEAPCPVLSNAEREAMGAAALKAAEAVEYRGAGTVEFLLAEDGAFYFLEMNTRLQVEHPVTEMISGLDLVELQIKVAGGAPLGLTQGDVALSGHAMEARLYAEDPAREFLPVTGRIAHWRAACGAGVRVDSGVESGSDVSPFYDPMLAKIIAWGEDRETARKRLLEGLKNTACLGLTTNGEFLAAIVDHPDFANGNATAAFLEEAFGEGIRSSEISDEMYAVGAALIAEMEAREMLGASLVNGSGLIGFSSDGARPAPIDLIRNDTRFSVGVFAVGKGAWRVVVNNVERSVEIVSFESARAVLRIDGQREAVDFASDTAQGIFLQRGVVAAHLKRWKHGGSGHMALGEGAVSAPMPGQVISVDVGVGETVEKGQRIAVLEAMKMQHQLVAQCAGIIQSVSVAQGAQVAGGQVIVTMEEDDT